MKIIKQTRRPSSPLLLRLVRISGTIHPVGGQGRNRRYDLLRLQGDGI